MPGGWGGGGFEASNHGSTHYLAHAQAHLFRGFGRVSWRRSRDLWAGKPQTTEPARRLTHAITVNTTPVARDPRSALASNLDRALKSPSQVA